METYGRGQSIHAHCFRNDLWRARLAYPDEIHLSFKPPCLFGGLTVRFGVSNGKFQAGVFLSRQYTEVSDGIAAVVRGLERATGGSLTRASP